MKQILFQIWLWYNERRRLWAARPRKLKRAIRRAKRLQRKHNKRYRVYFLQNRYQCLTRQQIKKKIRSGEFQHNINVTKMSNLCFHDTLLGTPDFAKKLLTA